MPQPKRRQKVQRSRSREAQLRQVEAQKRKLTPREYMVRRAMGWTLVGVGIAILATHLMEHMQFFTLFTQAVDGIWYSMAGAFVIWGVIVLTKYSI